MALLQDGGRDELEDERLRRALDEVAEEAAVAPAAGRLAWARGVAGLHVDLEPRRPRAGGRATRVRSAGLTGRCQE